MPQRPFAKLASATALAASLMVLPFSGLAPAQAAAPMAKVSAPAFHRILLGDFEVTALGDGTVDLPVDKLLKESPAATAKALAKSFLKTPVETSVNAYLVNTGTKLILIDAGAGNLFGPTLGKLVANLKASGYTPEQVDEVYITHLHPDHVGGLASNDTLVFPNAVVRADKRDADFWLSHEQLAKAPEASKAFFQGAMASLNPYVKADRFRTFEGETELAPGVRAHPSYGHTAGHTSYVVESQGQRLIVLGDLIHVGAVQFDHPSVTIAFDSDAKTAAIARDKAFLLASEKGDLVAASHLSFPGLGHVRAQGNRYQWVPLNYTQAR